MGTGANILFDLEIANTIFVSKNGDDTTGEKGNWNQPFATLFGASQVAIAQDCIFVFAGTYDEVDNDWVKSDVKYFFTPSTLVQGLNHCISDRGIAKNINITGYGRFQLLEQTSFNGCLATTNPSSTVFFRGSELYGYKVGLGLFDALNFDVEADLIHSTDLYAITIRGNTTGVVQSSTIECFGSDATISMRNLNTDLVERTIIVKANLIRGNSNSFGSGVLTHVNTNTTKFIYSDFQIEHYGGASGGCYWTTASNSNKHKALFRNVIAISNIGYGVNGNGGGISQFNSCEFSTVNVGIKATNESIYAKDCYFKQTNNTVSTDGVLGVTNSAELQLENCTIDLDSTAPTRKCINIRTNAVRMSYCKLIATPLQSESIGSSIVSPYTIIVEGQCSSNRPVANNLTNIVAGTNIIVDANIGMNNFNFL